MPRDTMIRRQVYLTEREVLLLSKLSKQTGITISEHIRRAVDSYLLPSVASQKSAKGA